MLCITLLTDTPYSLNSSPGHRLPIVRRTIDCILKQHQDRAESTRPSVMYTVSIHHVCRGIGAMSITEVVFIEHEKSVVNINELLHHSITTDVNCYQICCDWQFCPSTGQCTGASCMEHSPTAGGKTLNFTFLITSLPQQQRGERHWL